MQKIFARLFCAVMAIALLILLSMAFLLQTRNSEHHMVENSRLKLDQISQTLKANDIELAELSESLEEDYLTRCRAFAYMIEQNPDILDSLEELNRVKILLNVDELHVIDENGILFSGTIPKYYGMDFRSTKQTAEFLQILDHPGTVLIQEVQPNGAEQKMCQYVGVSRQDRPGIVQVGLAPTRLLEARKRNEIPYILARVPMDAGCILFAIDAQTGAIFAHPGAGPASESLSQLGMDPKDLPDDELTGFFTVRGVKRYFVLRRYENLVLGIGQQPSVLYAERQEAMLLTALCLVATLVVVILVINHLLKVQIVDGIHRIMDCLSQISDGHLDTVARVDSNPEFLQLSTGINKMVNSLLQATVRVPKIIEMTEMPIGVFEIDGSGGRVMATERLRHVMNWSQDEADALYGNGPLFLETLHGIMQTCECRDSDVFQLSSAPEKWIRLHMLSDERGAFGVITDVTREVLSRKKIEHERDYDLLTGLCNIGKFRPQVNAVLDSPAPGVCAMAMLDLDHFKQINDQYGHDWGDRYLQTAANFLEKFTSCHCIAARRSGDEFCLFLHGFETQKQILSLLDRFYADIGANPIVFPNGTKKALEISAGLAWYEQTASNYDSLLRAADMALYQSKQNGRNRWTALSGQSYEPV